MTNTCECGSLYNEEGICTDCGLVDDEYADIRQHRDYPFDPDKKDYQYGDPRTHAVSDISVMTTVNLNECENPDLRRALQWDANFEWSVVKTEILNSNIKHICSCLGLNKDFIERCHYFFRSVSDKTIFTGKSLEKAAAALVYTLIRLDALPYSLYDFKLAGYDTRLIYRYYIEFVKQWNLIKIVKPQDTKMFVTKFINSLISDDPDIYRTKFELIKTSHHIFLYYYAIFNALDIRENIIQIEDLTLIVNNSGLPLLAAITYLVCKKHPGFKITQKIVADAAGVTEVTIRNYLNKIRLQIQGFERD